MLRDGGPERATGCCSPRAPELRRGRSPEALSHWIICWLPVSSAWLSSSFFFWSSTRRSSALASSRGASASLVASAWRAPPCPAAPFSCRRRAPARNHRRLELRLGLGRCVPRRRSMIWFPLRISPALAETRSSARTAAARASSTARSPLPYCTRLSSRPLSTLHSSSLSLVATRATPRASRSAPCSSRARSTPCPDPCSPCAGT